MNRLRWAALASMAVAAVVLAGCGGAASAAPPPTPGAASGPVPSVVPAPAVPTASPGIGMAVLKAEMESALKHATSVHVAGTGIRGTESADVNITRSGGLSGTVTVRHTADRVLVTGGHGYIEVTAAFLAGQHLPARVCPLMCGKWVRVTTGPLAAVTNAVTWAHVITPVAGAVSAGALAYRGGTRADRQPAYVLALPRLTVDVSAEGIPYVLRVLAPTSGGERLGFSAWNGAAIPASPPPGQVITLSQLSG